jgi:hypothetical protein
MESKRRSPEGEGRGLWMWLEMKNHQPRVRVVAWGVLHY